MFTIKFQYRGKAFNLGKNVTSLQKIHQEMVNRFPIDFKFGVKTFYGDIAILNFEDIKKISENSKLQSIKLRAEPATEHEKISKEKEARNEQKSIAITQKEQTVIFEVGSYIMKSVQADRKSEQDIKHSEKSLSFKRSQQSVSKKSGKQAPQSQNAKNPSSILSKGSAVHSRRSSSLKIIDQRSSSEKSVHSSSAKKNSQIKLQQDCKKSCRQSSSLVQPKQECEDSNNLVNQDAKEHSQKKDANKEESVDSRYNSQEKKNSIPGDRKSSRSRRSRSPPHKDIVASRRLKGSQNQDSLRLQDRTQEIWGKKIRDKVNSNKQQNKEQEQFSFRCSSSGIIQQICDGRINFQTNHPFVNFLNDVVQKRVQIILRKHGIIGQKQIVKHERRVESDIERAGLSNFKFEVIVGPNQKKKVKKAEPHYWEFEIMNVGQEWPSKMELYQEQKGYTATLPRLRRGKSHKLTIGPIYYDSVGSTRNSYKLGFYDENDKFQFLEQKFSFTVDVEAAERNILSNKFRKRVQDLAKKRKNKHSVDYLIEKFRDMGIQEENGHENEDDFLLDIIASLQGI